MLIGTYTAGSTSKGVYVAHFNQQTGKAVIKSSVSAGNPSYVVATDDNRFAYSVDEDFNNEHAAMAFRLDKVGARLTKLNMQSTVDASKLKTKENDGAAPCFIMTNGRQVVTANYNGGDISVFPVGRDGKLLPQSQHFCFEGDTVGAVPHLHCVRLTPDGRYLLANDLGNDCIYRFDVNSKADYKNRLPFLTNRTIVYRGVRGLGPRHITFSPNGHFAYLITEMGGVVVAFRYSNGKLAPIQYIMADEGDGHGSADIHISSDGKYLYTSHRLKKDGVAIFRIDQATGKLTKVGYQLTGKHPRNFNITPNGRFLLVACRDANEIQIFRRDASTGLLTDTGNTIEVGKPVCIQFLK
jgi:6-phosphogluconolactonase (cycloisomerase 2 family)